MKTKAFLIVFAILAVVAGFGLRATSEIADANKTLAALASQRDGLRTKTTGLENRLSRANQAIADADKNSAMLTTKSAAPSHSAAAAGAPASDQSAPVRRKLSPASLVANDPKKMAEYAKNYRESLDLTLGGMFRKLGLSTEQIEKVKDLTAWHEQGRLDLEAAAEAEGLDMQGKAYIKMRWGDLSDARRKKEAEIFGAGEFYERYRELRLNYYLRDTTQRIASAEMGAETPATFAQVERATEIILANSLRPETNNPQKWKYRWQAVGWGWQDWAAINWKVAEPQLQSVLSPAQYSVLRQFLRTQESWTAVANRNVENNREARRLVRQPGG